jgi:hypothetical protein
MRSRAVGKLPDDRIEQLPHVRHIGHEQFAQRHRRSDARRILARIDRSVRRLQRETCATRGHLRPNHDSRKPIGETADRVARPGLDGKILEGRHELVDVVLRYPPSLGAILITPRLAPFGTRRRENWQNSLGAWSSSLR